MQHSFLAIVGPTAVGKTDFALAKAQELLAAGAPGVDIISVDSKQVYCGLEILTGADVPAGYQRAETDMVPSPYRSLPACFISPDQRIFLHGISMIQPHEDWSVAHFQSLARGVMAAAAQQGRTVLFVGGTGLYYAQLFSTDERLRIGPDLDLRERAAQLSLVDLQREAELAQPSAYAELNNSDKHNPRRLIRLIEKATGTPQPAPPESSNGQLRYLGLRAELPVLEARIAARVERRLAGSAPQEVAQLLASSPAPTSQALATLGVAELRDYLTGKLSKVACATLWSLHEFQYAKRQLTWWKKQPVEWVNS